MRSPDYIDWSIKGFYYVSGVASTIVGSLLSSKIRVYHDARNSHRDELKQKVLAPLRKNLEVHYLRPQFTVSQKEQHYNPNASAAEYPGTYGMAISLIESASARDEIDEVLLEDARVQHYRALITSWKSFVQEWEETVTRQKEFIEAVAQELLAVSGLPQFPSPVPGPYVMHRNLGNFVYGRLVADSQKTLQIQPNADGPVMSDGWTSVAKGSEAQLENILSWVNGVMIGRRTQAAELRAGLARLEDHRCTLMRQLSLAIAEKKLHRRCSLVTFF